MTWIVRGHRANRGRGWEGDLDATHGAFVSLSYHEHVSDLLRGWVRVEGISLTTIELPVEEIFFRMLSFVEWDVEEFSVAKCVSLVGAGAPPFRAIPVFPSRCFDSPRSALRGERPSLAWAISSVAASVYRRGHRPPGSVLAPTCNEMLLAGDLDAILSAREPCAFLAGDPRVVRLWPDRRALEQTYYRETGIFAIMHVFVIKATTFDRHPWIAKNLFKAFEEAKTNSLRYLSSSLTSRVPLPCSHDAVGEDRMQFGDDFWPVAPAAAMRNSAHARVTGFMPTFFVSAEHSDASNEPSPTPPGS